MNNWFTSDLHFGHANIIQYCNRPYATVEEMDRALIDNWNSRVQPSDTVYVIGDVSFHRDRAKTKSLLGQLKGQINLVLGNHDTSLDGDLLARFGWVKDLYTLKVDDPVAHGNKQRIVLCHYAFRVWDQSHRGAWSLHGHSHGMLPDDPKLLSIDVGVDCHNYFPISYAEVKAIMAKKTWKPFDPYQGRV